MPAQRCPIRNRLILVCQGHKPRPEPVEPTPLTRLIIRSGNFTRKQLEAELARHGIKLR